MFTRVREVRAAERCPWCHGDLATREAEWLCPKCATLQHAACVREGQRCAVFGCGAKFTASAVRQKAPTVLPLARPARVRPLLVSLFHPVTFWFIALANILLAGLWMPRFPDAGPVVGIVHVGCMIMMAVSGATRAGPRANGAGRAPRVRRPR